MLENAILKQNNLFSIGILISTSQMFYVNPLQILLLKRKFGCDREEKIVKHD